MEVNKVLPLLLRKIEEGLTICDSCKALKIRRSDLYRKLDLYQKRELLATVNIALPKRHRHSKYGSEEFYVYQLLALDREDLYFEDED